MVTDRPPLTPTTPSIINSIGADDISFDFDRATGTFGVIVGESNSKIESWQPVKKFDGDTLRESPPPLNAITKLFRAKRIRKLFQLRKQLDEVEVSDKHFPFLQLPAELRNAVYEDVCRLTGFATSFMARGSCLIPPHLAKVCRQIRREVIPVFYAMNNFQLSMSPQHRDITVKCLQRVAPHIHHLRQVRSMAPDANVESWYIRFSMTISEGGTHISFISTDPLTQRTEEGIKSILLRSRDLRRDQSFNGRDFYTLFRVLSTFEHFKLEIDRERKHASNGEYCFQISADDRKIVIVQEELGELLVQESYLDIYL